MVGSELIAMSELWIPQSDLVDSTERPCGFRRANLWIPQSDIVDSTERPCGVLVQLIKLDIYVSWVESTYAIVANFLELETDTNTDRSTY